MTAELHLGIMSKGTIPVSQRDYGWPDELPHDSMVFQLGPYSIDPKLE